MVMTWYHRALLLGGNLKNRERPFEPMLKGPKNSVKREPHTPPPANAALRSIEARDSRLTTTFRRLKSKASRPTRSLMGYRTLIDV